MEHVQTYTIPQGISRAVKLAEAMASLDLLRIIDRTVETLVIDVRNFNEDARQLHEIADRIQKAPITTGVLLDKEGHAVDILVRAEEHLKTYIPQMILKRSAIDKDDNLSADHRASLHDGYEEWMVAASSLLEALKLVRHSIIGHDLDATDWEKCPTFDSAADAIAYLHEHAAQK